MTKSVIAFSLTGILTGTPDVPGKPAGKYVYQKTKAGHGNIPGDKSRRQQVRIWTAGTNPNTPAQIPFRSKFRDGVASWHTLSAPEKEALRRQAEKLHLNNFQLYMRLWMLATTPSTSVQWDADQAVWDDGTPSWDDGTDKWDYEVAVWDDGTTIWLS
jgi:hypothetical protein